MAKPTVIIVGADKGGVGKTTVARTLLDYFGAHGSPPAPSTPRLRAARSSASIRMRPRSSTSDLVADQMKIFDTLNAADMPVTVIDVRAGLLSQTLRALPRFRLHRRARARARSPLRCSMCSGPRSPRSTRSSETAAFLARRQLLPGEEFHQRYAFLPVGRETYAQLLQADQGRGRDHHPQAQRDGDRAGRAGVGPVRDLHRQQEARTASRRPIPSCCAAMSGTGSAMSGPNTTASG